MRTSSEDTYPLTLIRELATDMGVDDLAERHGHYAHGWAADIDPDVDVDVDVNVDVNVDVDVNADDPELHGA